MEPSWGRVSDDPSDPTNNVAEWIDKGVETQLPPAIRIIDIWHAYQHIHEVAKAIHGAESPEARGSRHL